MALWDKMKVELDRAGKAAQQALDEGKLRLELHRARGAFDRAAQRLGHAVYRARATGGDLGPEEYARYTAEMTSAETEVARLQRLIDEASAGRGTPRGTSEPQPPV